MMIWEKDLFRRVELDAQYQQQLEEVKKTETEFLKIRHTMPQTHQEILDNYLSACEELDHILTARAYAFGRETGERIRFLYPKEKRK